MSPHYLGVGTMQVLPYAIWQLHWQEYFPVQDVSGPPHGSGLRLVPSFCGS